MFVANGSLLDIPLSTIQYLIDHWTLKPSHILNTSINRGIPANTGH